MYDVICIGNIAIDLYFKGKSLTYKKERFQLAVGGKYCANYFHIGVGGGGANVGIGIQRHGLKSAVLGKIGSNPFKEIILESFRREKVTTYLCQFNPEYSNLSSILLTGSGEKTVINYQTPHQHIINSKLERARLEKTRCIFFGNLPDVSISERLSLLKFFHSKKIPVVVNLGVKDCRRPLSQLHEFLSLTKILILNTHEFSELIKREYQSIDFTKNVATNFKPLHNQVVILTDGKKGSYGYDNGKVYYSKPPVLSKIIDASGAGDAYTAGFISEYIQSGDIEKAMKNGTDYAKEILMKVGAN